MLWEDRSLSRYRVVLYKLEEKMKSDILEKENVDANNKKGNPFIEFLIKILNRLK